MISCTYCSMDAMFHYQNPKNGQFGSGIAFVDSGQKLLTELQSSYSNVRNI